MDRKDITELRQRLDELNNLGSELATHASRFAQNWYLVANAGGATASIGYLGAFSDQEQGPKLYAALITLTFFLIGFGFSLYAATLHARHLGDHWKSLTLWITQFRAGSAEVEDAPEPDKNAYDRMTKINKIGRICMYGGGGIGLFSLWAGQIYRTIG